MFYNQENFDPEPDLILFFFFFFCSFWVYIDKLLIFSMESVRTHSTRCHAPFCSTYSYSFRENNSRLSWKIYRCMEQNYEAKLKVRCHQGLWTPSENDGVWNVKYMSDHQFRVRADFMEEAEIRI